jgi:outer membrane protein OmpA-like peptidoglycan-associated protein
VASHGENDGRIHEVLATVSCGRRFCRAGGPVRLRARRQRRPQRRKWPAPGTQVFFDTDKADLSPRGQLIVNKVAEVVTNNDGVRVTVIGRTDRSGNASANMALSERRAELVRDALITAGVPSARIDTSWLGEGKQDVPTLDDVVKQRNRVVDVVVQESS